jgi:redox-sensitive bicupin YhaK (pirin superfamily)
MITVRKSEARGHFDHGWLDTRHTFSFADYYDPKSMGFRALRVINEDRVKPGQGFGTHGHRDMEIISYVLSGAIEHRDSLGTGEVLRPGEVQRMSAGTGVRHSEFNPSQTEGLHFLQIWLLPREAGGPPSYEQRAFPLEERRGKLRVLASPDGRDGSLGVNQDALLYGAVLGPGQAAELPLAPGRHAWVQVARGSVHVNGATLSAGDGAALSDETAVRLDAPEETELLVFDLA